MLYYDVIHWIKQIITYCRPLAAVRSRAAQTAAPATLGPLTLARKKVVASIAPTCKQ